VQTVEMCWRES